MPNLLAAKAIVTTVASTTTTATRLTTAWLCSTTVTATAVSAFAPMRRVLLFRHQCPFFCVQLIIGAMLPTSDAGGGLLHRRCAVLDDLRKRLSRRNHLLGEAYGRIATMFAGSNGFSVGSAAAVAARTNRMTPADTTPMPASLRLPSSVLSTFSPLPGSLFPDPPEA